MFQIEEFQKKIEKKYSLNFNNYNIFHKWSIENFKLFWLEFLEFSNISYNGDTHNIYNEANEYLDSKWFNNVKLNYAANCLELHDPLKIAIYAYDLNGIRANITYAELKKKTHNLANYMRSIGLKQNDVVTCLMPNNELTIIAFLAATSIGCVFASSDIEISQDIIYDRFSTINPKLLISHIDPENIEESQNKINYLYNNIDSYQFLIQTDNTPNKENIDLNDILNQTNCEENFDYYQANFNDPLYILFSSGTTGKPKAIVHAVGRSLIQHQKELILHCDMKPSDNLFYYTTCNWMMWNWMVSALTIGGSITTYSASPLKPTKDHLFKIIDEAHVSIFGTSAKYLTLVEKFNINAKKKYQMDYLKLILSTGSPISEQNFDFVENNIKSNIKLASIAGGTDIVSCFVLGCPTIKSKRGYIDCKALAMDVVAFNDKNEKVTNFEGELVCLTPFPSMPIYFQNDINHEKYKNTYFKARNNIWYHGDFILEDSDGYLKILGRSDTTLNPSGVRIGTAEIYKIIDKIDEIEDSLVIGLREKGDDRIYLFITLNEKMTFDNKLKIKIKKQIKTDSSPHHVPHNIIQVNQIPYTSSGKKIELPIKKLLMGKITSEQIQAVSNPNSLNDFNEIKEKIFA